MEGQSQLMNYCGRDEGLTSEIVSDKGDANIDQIVQPARHDGVIVR